MFTYFKPLGKSRKILFRVFIIKLIPHYIIVCRLKKNDVAKYYFSFYHRSDSSYPLHFRYFIFGSGSLIIHMTTHIYISRTLFSNSYDRQITNTTHLKHVATLFSLRGYCLCLFLY